MLLFSKHLSCVLPIHTCLITADSTCTHIFYFFNRIAVLKHTIPFEVGESGIFPVLFWPFCAVCCDVEESGSPLQAETWKFWDVFLILSSWIASLSVMRASREVVLGKTK